MVSIIYRFDKTPIEGAVSRSGVFAAFDWEQLVLPPTGEAILTKAKASTDKRLAGFSITDQALLIRKLGHYSDVQSVNCEDTVTWSVFGFAQDEGWLCDMLHEVFGPADRPSSWEVLPWSRVAHPLTGKVEHGPESDIVIQSTSWRYVVEAKWTSDISVHTHGQDQIEMRAYQAQSCQFSPDRSGVVVVAPSPPRYVCAQKANSRFRHYFEPAGDSYLPLSPAEKLNAKAITWEKLVRIISGRGRPRLGEFMDWRLSHIR